MTTEEWVKIETIVDEVLDLPADEQERNIRQLCGDDPVLVDKIHSFIASISDADRFFSTSDTLKEKIVEAAASEHAVETDYEELIGETIGAYRLKQLLGIGGMGAVYLGSRADGQFEHTVAVKVIQNGIGQTEIRARFMQERQILAGLSHENIGRLYDGGITNLREGTDIPYLIMEYVNGVPIDQYCNENRLPVDKRIELFESVCDAARYAHKNLVIHRDLKPANILITSEGKVKVMDFGIAKLANHSHSETSLDDTNERSKFLSLSSAAPEQVNDDAATTATDIYALGILLYKLVSGSHPLPVNGKSPGEVRRIIDEEKPEICSDKFSGQPRSRQVQIAEERNSTPASVYRKLRKDLDSILDKCLKNRPENRYQTVEDLLDDLHRYKNKYPVKAHRQSNTYRAKKYIQRNRTPLFFSTIFLCLAVFLVVFYTYQVQQERDIANLEANKANQVTEFVLDLFEGNDPVNTGGEDISARELLNRGIEKTKYLTNQPVVQADMFEVLGRLLTQLGEYDEASELLTKSIDLRTEHLGESHIETVASHEYLGNLLSSKGDLFEAEEVLQHAIEKRIELVGVQQAALAESNAELAYVYRRLGKFDAAEKIYTNLVDIYSTTYGENDPLTLKSISSLGVTLHSFGKLEQAEKHHRNVLEKRIRLYNTAHPDVAMSYNNLGSLLMNMGRYDEAKTMLFNALDMRKTLFGDVHPKVSLTLNNIGILKRNTGDFEGAREYINRALLINRDLFGENGLQTAMNLFSLADLFMMTNDYEQALSHYQQSNQIFTDNLPDGASFIARTAIGIGEAMLHLGSSDHREADTLIRNGYKQVGKIHPGHSIEFGLASLSIGKLCLFIGKTAEGLNHLNTAYQIISRIEGNNSPRALAAQNLLQQ